MRVLLSVVGTRGDVQPVIALGLQVRELGHEVRLCLPPNFITWAQDLGFSATSLGIEMRAPRPGVAAPPVPDLIADQFETIALAARGCDVILGANAHQYAARSIAELHGIPYLSALYAPSALPTEGNSRAWNERSRDRVNANRRRLGLAAIDDVLSHIVTNRPWLATDPLLDPPSASPGITLVQTGAWILTDESPLSAELEHFLAAGEPPVYVGFGSMPAAEGTSRTLIEATRAAGRRAIVARGWAELGSIDHAADCIVIGDVNQQALFPRVAAVVHHGGAGTTHAAARAGVPQVLVPMFGDQPHWANRVRELGLGTSLPLAELGVDRLATALRDTIQPTIVARATAIAPRIASDGAAVAARRLSDTPR